MYGPYFQEQNFNWRFLRGKRETMHVQLKNAEPATAANYEVFAIMPFNGYIEEVWETHRVASTSGTVNIEILSSTQALDGGKTALSSALSTAGAADTPQRGTLSTTLSDRQFNRGDRLALKDAGTLTNSAGLLVTVIAQYKY